MLREALLGMGARCGVEPRVLKPRESDWTCYLDSPAWRGDIYIHDVTQLYSHRAFLSPLVILFVTGILLGLIWGRYFWRKGQSAKP